MNRFTRLIPVFINLLLCSIFTISASDHNPLQTDYGYIDEMGHLWQFDLTLYEEESRNLFTLVGPEGEYTFPFEDYPYFASFFEIKVFQTPGEQMIHHFGHLMNWPSIYIHSQWDNYSGELDDNNKIPADSRDYSRVGFAELCNSDKYVKLFARERPESGGEISEDCWQMPVMTANSFDTECIFDGKTHFFTDSQASRIFFESYDEETGHLSAEIRMYFTDAENWQKRMIRTNYNGSMRLHYKKSYDYPDLGSSDINTIRDDMDHCKINIKKTGSELELISDQPAEISVTTLNGNLILTSKLNTGEPTRLHLPKGFYLIKSKDFIKKILL